MFFCLFVCFLNVVYQCSESNLSSLLICGIKVEAGISRTYLINQSNKIDLIRHKCLPIEGSKNSDILFMLVCKISLFFFLPL